MNWLKRKVVNKMVNDQIGKVSSDAKTTALGVILGGIQALNIDWVKLFTGDGGEVGKTASAVALLLLGYFSNKK